MQPYFVGAFILPVAALIVATVFEFSIPTLRKNLPDALIRIGWDGAVTALGLTGAIGSDFANLTSRQSVAVVSELATNGAMMQTAAILWVLLCLAILLGIRSTENPGYGKGFWAIVLAAIALGSPAMQAYVIGTTVIQR
jgi:hypothetical protein